MADLEFLSRVFPKKIASCIGLNEVFWFKHTEYTYHIIYTYIHIFNLFFWQQGILRNTGASILGPPLAVGAVAQLRPGSLLNMILTRIHSS